MYVILLWALQNQKYQKSKIQKKGAQRGIGSKMCLPHAFVYSVQGKKRTKT